MTSSKVPISSKQKKGIAKQPAKVIKKDVSYSKYFLPSILIITAIVFANSLQNDFIINWDDREYIINNPLIKDLNWKSIKEMFSTFQIGNYHPLTMISYAIEYKFFGLNPFYFHLTNYIFHLLNVILVYLLIRQMSGNPTVALITSVFFAIHPMHVESVSWISERKDVLYSFFFLISLFFYHKFLLSDKKISYLAGSLLFFIFSLLSKPAAVCLPVVLILIDFYQGNKISFKSVLSKTPFFLLSFIFGIVAIRAQQSFDAITQIGSDINIVDRVFMFSYSILYYLFKVFLPFNLSALHFYPIKSNSFLPFEYYLSLLGLIFVIWAVIKSKILKKEILFGLSFYFATIVMVLPIIPLGMAIVSERYSYIPYIGVFFIMGQFFSYVKENKLSYGKKVKPFLIPIFLFLVFLFSYLTFQRNKIWDNGIVLFTDIIKKYPNEGYGWWARGNGYMEMSDFESALSDYNKSILLGSSDAVLFTNRGIAKVNLRYYNEALPDYNSALNLKPDYSEAWFNRGTLFLVTGKYDKALSDFTVAIKHKPEYFEAYCNRGAAFAYLNKMDESLAEFNKAIEINPVFAEAYFSRGFTKLSLNDTKGACSDWSVALQLGYSNAGNALNQYCK